MDSISEAEFEAIFHELPDPDPVAEAQRATALKTNEEIVKEANEAFKAGKQTWYDAINEMANIPEKVLEAEKTGLVEPHDRKKGRGLGLIMPANPEDYYHEASERYFDQFREERQDVPDSYSSVALGTVQYV